MTKILFIFLGGGLGSLSRYSLGLFLNKNTLPFGTALANILGSLLIGLVMGYHIKYQQNTFSDTQLACLVTGFLGGFTTFSSFMYENIQYLSSEQYSKFFIYFFSSITLGLLATFTGYYIGKNILLS